MVDLANVKVLGEVGENYTMMKAFFPGRTVAQIKKKGVRENAKNPEKVTAAINARRPIGESSYPVPSHLTPMLIE